MRIIKLSKKDDEFKKRPMVDTYFRDTLPNRNPPGKFLLSNRAIGQDGISPGETLVFTYEGECVYRARAASTRQTNRWPDNDKYPHYFLVDIPSIRAIQGTLPAIQDKLKQAGLADKNLVKSRAWMRFPDGGRIGRLVDAFLAPAQDMHGDFHADCVRAIEAKLQIQFTNIHRSLYVSDDETIAVVCVTSKLHPNKAFQYWFTIQQAQDDFLAKHKQGFLLLGCGSSETIFAIPFREFEPWRKKLLVSKHNGNHVRINGESGNFYLHFKGRGEKVEITGFRLKSGNDVPDVDAPTPFANDLPDGFPERRDCFVHRFIRDTKTSRQVKDLYENRCQVCGERLEILPGKFYAEAHHLQPIGGEHKGPDVKDNILCLCPNHHALFDYFAIFLDPAKLLLNKHDLRKLFVDYHNGHFRNNCQAA
jgi:hypothetical protein